MTKTQTVLNTARNIQEFQVVMKKVSELTPYLKNARTHDKAQISLIAESIKEFGFNNPILTDGKNGVIAGHGRLAAAVKLGMATVPTISLSHLSTAQKKAYVIADNQIATRSGWDEALLREELAALGAEGFDIALLGFADKELRALTAGLAKGNTDEDEIPELQENPVSRLGDTWLLGQHRVRCGDSTSAEDVKALLDGAKPHLMVTDPPYGVEYDANWRNEAFRADGSTDGGRAIGKVKNDDRADWREAWALFPGNIAYVWHDGNMAGVVQDSLTACGFKTRAQIIWAKDNFAIGRGDYHWKHEPCWYAVKGTGKWCGDRSQTTLWDIPKPMKSETGHSTQKPVECMRRPMLNNSVKGDMVYDPFLGSGTTVIAAETEGRVCYGMELSPVYVDIIVKRWETFTGKSATLGTTGQTFAEVNNGRL